jgi:hypothetical protein
MTDPQLNWAFCPELPRTLLLGTSVNKGQERPICCAAARRSFWIVSPTSSRPPSILAARELPRTWHSHGPNGPGPPEGWYDHQRVLLEGIAGISGEGL